jgi:hypothetical protein
MNIFKKIITWIKRFISDLFYAQYIASFTEGGDFKTAKEPSERRWGKKNKK